MLQSFTTLIACLPCSCQTVYSIRGLLFGKDGPFSCQLIPGEHSLGGKRRKKCPQTLDFSNAPLLSYSVSPRAATCKVNRKACKICWSSPKICYSSHHMFLLLMKKRFKQIYLEWNEGWEWGQRWAEACGTSFFPLPLHKWIDSTTSCWGI